jgi:hypothetical protein
MKNRPQCKDIPDRPILEFLAKNPGKWHCRYGGYENSVTNAMPEWVDDGLALAKMRQLYRRGVAYGCTCGCRGDFEITEKGMREIGVWPEDGKLPGVQYELRTQRERPERAGLSYRFIFERRD